MVFLWREASQVSLHHTDSSASDAIGGSFSRVEWVQFSKSTANAIFLLYILLEMDQW